MWVRANFKTVKAVLSIYRSFLQEMMSYTFVHLGSSEFKNTSISETLWPAPSANHSVCHTCLHSLLVLSMHIVLVSQYVFWLSDWLGKTKGNQCKCKSPFLQLMVAEESGSQGEAQANVVLARKPGELDLSTYFPSLLTQSHSRNKIPSEISTSEGKVDNQRVDNPHNPRTLPFSWRKVEERRGVRKGAGWIDSESPITVFATETNIRQMCQFTLTGFFHILKNYSFTFSYLNYTSSQICGMTHRNITWSFHSPQALELGLGLCGLSLSGGWA